MKRSKKILFALFLTVSLLLSVSATADNATSSFLPITKIRVHRNGTTSIWLSGVVCNSSHQSFKLGTPDTVVDRIQSLATAAFLAGKRVQINYDASTCEIYYIQMID